MGLHILPLSFELSQPLIMTLPDFSGQHVGRYHITSPLSSGSTSSVYGAIADAEHAGKYAVKCISKFDLTPKQLLLRTSEVFHHQLVTGCSPHVLPLKEIIDEDLYLFIVSKRYEGDLFQAIWDHRIFQRNDALIKETFLDILDGVYACHTRGVFHRDLKPENILCREGGTGVRIADFGLATRKRICRGSRCGTPDYMSPEQWTENDIMYYPSLTDIWALGVILLNMVTGRRPWKVARASDVQFQAFLDDEHYLYNTFPISRALDDVLKWILRPNPMERLQILQIRQAILNMDTFYRIPQSSDDAALGWSREVCLIQEGHFRECLDAEDSLDEDGRTKRTSCRPVPHSLERGFVHELFDPEDAVVSPMELSLALSCLAR